jgi:hypothetical protein
VEVVKRHTPFLVGLFLGWYVLAYRTLIVWWTVAVWFPELGLTYWQLVLPIYAFTVLTHKVELKPILPKGFRNYK